MRMMRYKCWLRRHGNDQTIRVFEKITTPKVWSGYFICINILMTDIEV